MTAQNDPQVRHTFSAAPRAVGEYEADDPHCLVCGFTVHDYLHQPIEAQVAKLVACVTCGAMDHGNIGCERCLLTWTQLSAPDRDWFVRYAAVRVTWSPYV